LDEDFGSCIEIPGEDDNNFVDAEDTQ